MILLNQYPPVFKITNKAKYRLFEKSRVHPYFASFHPSVPGTLIEWFTKKNDVVLDPFCGSGTTLVQAKLASRKAIGIDANPIACLISKVRTTKINNQRLGKSFDILKKIERDVDVVYKDNKNIENALSELKIPKIHNLDHWFKKEVLFELGIIKKRLDQVEDEDLRNIYKVAFSNIIVRVSNQSHETRYARKEKDYLPYDAFARFQLKLESIVNEIKLYSNSIESNSCKIICEDLRNHIGLDKESVDAVVTSPPYLNAWDYHLYQRFRLYWLGYKPNELRDIEIGAHLTHYQDPKAVERYSSDMSLCFKNIQNVLKKGKKCAIVIGDSIVHGKNVNIGKLLEKLAIDFGFSCEKNYRQTVFGPHYSQHNRNRKKLESILILEKN